MIRASEPGVRRGGPLAVFAVLALSWIGARALLWESPFHSEAFAIPGAELLLAEGDKTHRHLRASEAAMPELQTAQNDGSELVAVFGRSSGAAAFTRSPGPEPAAAMGRLAPRIAAGHQMLWLAGMGEKLPPGAGPEHAMEAPAGRGWVTPTAPVIEENAVADRWSLDGWAFWRQGSNATIVSQGRVPIYGASQIGANLQYRIAPSSSHDPRGFVRAYRALVSGGETELAAGVSARPLALLPMRVAAELRVTENDFGREVRPAAIVVTELPPLNLPARFRLEAYGGAGYVGGDAATAFADGQVAATRKLAEIDGPADTGARISIGAGAWAGAQKDASRVDLGPTVRLDLTLGDVPARLSVDWRERVSGDAAPDSGIAATLSTRF